MKKLISIACILSLALASHLSQAQPRRYTVANAHSHNDYLNSRPFYNAYQHGFASVEADVFAIGGKLVVAHSNKEINHTNTLSKLYLDPLAKELAANPMRRIKLLVDIKDNYRQSLDLLLTELRPLSSYLTSPGDDKGLQILITGNRPPPAEYKNYPLYILFDDDLKLAHQPGEWSRVGQVSLSFTRYSSWKGDGKPLKADMKKLKHVVDSVHYAGKTIRFWAAPDSPLSWKLQKKLGADLIGTDKVEELGRFLR